MTRSLSSDETFPLVASIPTRRVAIHRAVSIVLTTSSVLGGVPGGPAFASSEKEAISPEMVDLSFEAVRSELESSTGGIAYLKSCIDKKDYDAILEFTKTYDLEFRKAKMVKARKMLDDKDLKEKALYFSNAVTFDLIGMNKASRKGQENIEEVAKYWEELKKDIDGFLALQPK